MGGILAHMRNESVRTVAMYPGVRWLVAPGATGPFTTAQFVSTDRLDEIRRSSGVAGASPLLVLRGTIDRRDVNIVGYQPGGLTQPIRLTEGKPASAPGQAVVDASLHRRTGDVLTIAGRRYRVVGVTTNTTFYFSSPTVFLTIEDVQNQFLAGQRLASAILVRSDDTFRSPAGMDLLTTAQVKADLDRPLATSIQTLDIINLLLWVMAAGTIGAIVYLTALDRARDFAVFKATGTSGTSMAAGLILEAAFLSTCAGILAAGVARLIAPTFPFPVELTATAAVRSFVVALVVGVVASVAGVRRGRSWVDPGRGVQGSS